jgi:hypothetical protein
MKLFERIRSRKLKPRAKTGTPRRSRPLRSQRAASRHAVHPERKEQAWFGDE